MSSLSTIAQDLRSHQELVQAWEETGRGVQLGVIANDEIKDAGVSLILGGDRHLLTSIKAFEDVRSQWKGCRHWRSQGGASTSKSDGNGQKRAHLQT